jgi:hypothetical protein
VDKAKCVYRIPCECGRECIGENGRSLNTGIREEKYSLRQDLLERSKLAAHAFKEEHRIDWKNTTILQSQTNCVYRQFQEAANMLSSNNPISQPSLPHPPYSPDLAPCDFFLFPKLKTHLKGPNFGTVENVQAAATRALNKISSEDFLHCYEEWQQRWNRCIRSQGAYFEGDKLQLHVCSIKFFLNHSHCFWDKLRSYLFDGLCSSFVCHQQMVLMGWCLLYIFT